MKIIWKKDIEKKFYLNTEGLKAILHFKKEGDEANIPDEFEAYVSKKLSDPIKTGLCELSKDEKKKSKSKKVITEHKAEPAEEDDAVMLDDDFFNEEN